VFSIDFWIAKPHIHIIKFYMNEFSSGLGNVMSEWLILVQYVAVYIFVFIVKSKQLKTGKSTTELTHEKWFKTHRVYSVTSKSLLA